MILMRLDPVLRSEPVVRPAPATGKKNTDPFCQIRLERGRAYTAQAAVFKQRESERHAVRPPRSRTRGGGKGLRGRSAAVQGEDVACIFPPHGGNRRSEPPEVKELFSLRPVTGTANVKDQCGATTCPVPMAQ